MIIMYDMKDAKLPRLLTSAVERVARAMPVVVVTGGRQTGKTTLVRDLLRGRRPYYTLDDLPVLEQARRAPEELAGREQRLVLDEVQRAPELLLAVKRAVDEGRAAGRFILTGSANLLLMKRVSESLAGRATYLTLWPLTHRELIGLGRAGLWTELFAHPVAEWAGLVSEQEVLPLDWREVARRGGYPVPTLEMRNAEDRVIWFNGYIRTYLERDLQEIAAIENIVDFRRLMSAACLRLGQMVNQTELGRDVQLTQPTVRRWLNLLETSYQLVRLDAYSVNRTKRLIKTPKLYWCDTGLAVRLGGDPPLHGGHLENLVLTDLLAWRDSSVVESPGLFYWRTATGEEVDFVIEREGELLAIEVKATTNPRPADAAHLRTFRDEYGDAVRGCLLLHGGERVEWLGPRILAAPWWKAV